MLFNCSNPVCFSRFEILRRPLLPHPRAWILIAASHFSIRIERLKATESWTFPTIENKLFNLWWSPQKTNDQLIKFLFHWKALHNSWRRQLRTFAVCESINIAREWTWIIRQINYEINHATNCVTETIRTKLLLCREGSRSSEFHSRIAIACCQCMKNIAAWCTSCHANLISAMRETDKRREKNCGGCGKGGLRDVPEHNGIWNGVKFAE